MRKIDEIALYAAVREERGTQPWGKEHARPVDEIAIGLGIPVKRALALLDKWDDKGWWDFGVSLRYGWMTKTAPQSLKVWGVVQ